MSELTLSLKNKKSAGQGKQPHEPNLASYAKPLVSAGRVPQSTKHTPAAMDNLSGRSYTQRIGAANAHLANVTYQGHSHIRHNGKPIQQIKKNQIIKQPTRDGKEASEAERSDSKMTPRKKIVKLVHNSGNNNHSGSGHSIVLGGNNSL